MVEVILLLFSIRVGTFEKRYRSEKNARAKTRAHVLLLRRQKYTQKEIADIVCVTQGTVSNICRRFEKEKWQALYDKPRDGRPAQLSTEQKDNLRVAMQQEIVDENIRRGWQTKDVKQFLKKQYNVKFTQRHITRILHELNMSWKVPRPEHKNRDEKAVRAFKKTSRGRPSLWQPITKSSA